MTMTMDKFHFLNQTIEDLCSGIVAESHYKDEVIRRLRDKIENLQNDLQDKTYKDKEMQRLKKERDEALSDARRGFPISREEHEKIAEWVCNHEKEKHSSSRYPRGGAIGGSYSYCFTPTSIGIFGTIRCSCGEEFCFQEEA